MGGLLPRDRLSEQIEYDYDAALEKCKKKLEKKENYSDVGEEAMALAVKHAKGKKTRKEKEGLNGKN